MFRVNILLFEKFETLDVFGPVEVLGLLPDEFKMNFISCSGGTVTSDQGAPVCTSAYTDDDSMDQILFIPGGVGMMNMIRNEEFITLITRISEKSKYILTVCTGSVLLAKAGKLNGKKATTNKRLYRMLTSKFENVSWVKQARWVLDGSIYTSSGVSAGIDMTLQFVENLFGIEKAKAICNEMEYIRNDDCNNDPFAKLNGLI